MVSSVRQLPQWANFAEKSNWVRYRHKWSNLRASRCTQSISIPSIQLCNHARQWRQDKKRKSCPLSLKCQINAETEIPLPRHQRRSLQRFPHIFFGPLHHYISHERCNHQSLGRKRAHGQCVRSHLSTAFLERLYPHLHHQWGTQWLRLWHWNNL